MSSRKVPPPPVDAVAEALVLADPHDIGSLEELDRRLAILARWVGKSGTESQKQQVKSLSEAVRDLRRNPDLGPRALERIGTLFCSLDSSLGHGRPTLSAPAARRAVEPVAKRGTGGEASDAVPPAGAAPELAQDPELIADFITRANEHLESAEESLISLERDTADGDALNSTFRAFHTVKGMAGFLSLDRIQHLAHAAEDVLDDPRHGRGALGPAALQQLFGAVDGLRVLVQDLNAAHQAGDLLPDAPRSDEPGSSGTDAVDPPRAVACAPASDDAWKPDSVAPQAAVTRTVRVDEDRLDRLVDSIGELVIAESMVSEAAKDLGGAWTLLAQRFGQLDAITRRLQEMATSLRMVPLRSTFRRMARVTRDMSVTAGKPVDLVLEGEDTEIDKEMVDRIADPLTHLLRNAVDHGLETPDARRAAGKPSRGRIALRAYHRGSAVNIEVADDGAGLDLDRILAKARELGFVGSDDRPADRDLADMIFEPGFSTAAEVTEVSGRGVGMDVVRRVVEGLRGHTEVWSAPGEGTRFVIKLPLTLAIIDGMTLRVAGERYVLPLTAIERSVRPSADRIATALGGRGEMLTLDDGLVPIVRLDRLFGIAGAEQDPTQAVVVIVSEGGRRAGLLACELLGQQQTVIKPLGDAFNDSAGLAGGAIMPDGRVGLILDVAGLVQFANVRGGE